MIIQRKDFDSLIHSLSRRGFAVIGPVLRDQVIVYDEVHAASDFPVGWTEVREQGTYRLSRRGDAAIFGFTVGPQGWKRFLFLPRTRLFEAVKRGKSVEFRSDGTSDRPPRYAFVGVRSCDLNAIGIQDKVFMSNQFRDPMYVGRRQNLFVVAVNCIQSSGTCFCVSMKTGPRASSAFDLALTEVVGSGAHFFVTEVGSEAGAEVLKEVPHRDAESAESAAAARLIESAAETMGRTLNTADIRDLLHSNLENPHWDVVARRCLMCANCTMVCPTCFCSNVDDVTDLAGEHAERWRRWDSCFALDFAKVTGGNFRPSPHARYRQWMTHKLASWIDQFGVSGCVGCGRCIAWCPVGIDITAEVGAIRKSSNRFDA